MGPCSFLLWVMWFWSREGRRTTGAIGSCWTSCAGRGNCPHRSGSITPEGPRSPCCGSPTLSAGWWSPCVPAHPPTTSRSGPAAHSSRSRTLLNKTRRSWSRLSGLRSCPPAPDGATGIRLTDGDVEPVFRRLSLGNAKPSDRGTRARGINNGCAIGIVIPRRRNVAKCVRPEAASLWGSFASQPTGSLTGDRSFRGRSGSGRWSRLGLLLLRVRLGRRDGRRLAG